MTGFLTSFSGRDALLWGHQPLKLTHGLREQALFSRPALARLIETYPREHYSLIAMGAQQGGKLWQEGDLAGASGETVLNAIATGRLWLNLRNVSGVSAAHRDLLDGIFAELHRTVPGFQANKWQSGILISSPGAQVYYHADLPGQLLWQIAGRKRLWLYPTGAPFLTDRHLEDIALFDVEVDIPYAPWYDEHARVFDLAPGEMLSWPLNAPHRVENLEGLSISMTVSFSSPAIRRAEVVHLANGLLRHRFGIAPKSRRIEGPGYYAKAVLQKLMRDSGWVRAQRQARREIAFQLDASGKPTEQMAAE
ncbi:MAG: cupin-like domain-containing protein [Pseudomonadota bacterium]